jgi:hypothetical protein
MNVAQNNTALDSTVTIVFFLKRDRSLLQEILSDRGTKLPHNWLAETKGEAVSVLGEE